MTDHDAPRRFGFLDCNSPIASWRFERQVGECAAGEPGVIVDIGCGWGELLQRVVARVPGAKGYGIDADLELLERGRAGAAERGIADRVEFVEYQGRDWETPADLVICIGAVHAFGTGADAIRALYRLVKPGGRLLLGDGIWNRVPAEAELASMWPGTTAEDFLLLPDLVDVAVATGFRPLRVESVEQSEWDDFESQYLADKEVWLQAHPDHPKAREVREAADQHRDWWLRGHRGVLGFAYLTLGRPVASV
ncbi:methyltransferase domain-containing protein [Glycomyces sp. TRM65418]|uniref:SAM-dependent methyltransferase n=1 Tax=Glycomyces sp. TRM65418 TaxID=2867006 RepID=UPI001CE57062|nr:class I SAM-dependent methyltransferase [Glycomyces sp. TRM65418]MCC3763255.1 methyltransferase domain-containing protein [Glycomyces sp. TRM65418]QZD57256.1 methyltransferase domain-containing protein [Glycomyces sp. TRM65418]